MNNKCRLRRPDVYLGVLDESSRSIQQIENATSLSIPGTLVLLVIEMSVRELENWAEFDYIPSARAVWEDGLQSIVVTNIYIVCNHSLPDPPLMIAYNLLNKPHHLTALGYLKPNHRFTKAIHRIMMRAGKRIVSKLLNDEAPRIT